METEPKISPSKPEAIGELILDVLVIEKSVIGARIQVIPRMVHFIAFFEKPAIYR